MPITLELRFPAGRYHATPWGRHVNEGVPEWPPSPWRLLRALVATWKRKCGTLPEALIRQVLGQLVQPPEFFLPPARVAHTRHYMPWGKKDPDARTLVFDTFVAINRNNPVAVHWPNASFTTDEVEALRHLVDKLTTLGRAEGWVTATLADSPPAPRNCFPSGVAGAGQELVSVFCPDPATAFGDDHYPPPPDSRKLKKGLRPDEFLFDCPRWHLCLDTEIIHGERWPRVPGALWRSYARPADVFTQTPLRPPSPDMTTIPTVARFLLDGPVLPLVADTVRVAEAFRAAVMSRFAGWCRRQPAEVADRYRRPGVPDRFASPILAGKDLAGRCLPGHDHAHYLPTAEGEDRRRITHLTVHAQGGLGAGETAVLSGLRLVRVGDLELRAQLIGLGRPTDFRGELFGGVSGASQNWVSVTPYVGPAHVGRAGRERWLRKAIRREVRRWLSLQCPGVEAEEVGLLPDTDPLWAGRPRPLEFIRGRSRPGDDGYRRPAALCRLRFSAAVAGPICLGYASHYGLGLFLPAQG